MPSPFPGMDPYLEGHLWTSFHAHLATGIARQLLPQLRPKYIALPERTYSSGPLEDVMISTRSVIPDVGVRKTRHRELPVAQAGVHTAPVRLRNRFTTRIPHYRIEIRDTEKRRLVTAIELLSPTNKGSRRREYLRKRSRFLRSSAHLLEIDLHHQGKRIPLLDPYPAGAYFVLLTRARRRSWTDVWSSTIDAILPVVPVPLLKGDADVSLDLQAALTQVYDDGGFDLVVDYRKPPDVSLPPDEADWVAKHLLASRPR